MRLRTVSAVAAGSDPVFFALPLMQSIIAERRVSSSFSAVKLDIGDVSSEFTRRIGETQSSVLPGFAVLQTPPQPDWPVPLTAKYHEQARRLLGRIKQTAGERRIGRG